jgi:predicted tellurium resistance membrane protein TerC
VITAVGMAQHLAVMVVAVVIAVLIMMIFAGAVTSFIEKHPTIKMLALSFLLLIGVMLTAESFHYHVNHAFIYFAMGFSLFVEVLNIRSGSRHHRAHGTGT